MTYQDQLVLVEEGISALSNGMSWEEWEYKISSVGLSSKAVNVNNVKVIKAIDESFGEPILNELEATGNATMKTQLHQSVFVKLVDRRTQQAKSRLRKKIHKDILQGTGITEALEVNAHPFLDENIKQSAQKLAHSLEKRSEEEVKGTSTFSLVLGVLLLGFGVGLPFVSALDYIPVGSILAGLFLLVRFVILVAR